MNRESGIYQIRNLINNKRYIGQTSNFENRKNCHFRSLKGGYNKNKHLQNAYNKYGLENFVFEILIYCEREYLTKYEQFFVDKEKESLLYNNRIKCVDSNKGFKYSKETIKKRSGKNHPMYGKHLSKEHKQKISRSLSGENHPFYGLKGKNNPLYGKCHSEETKKKMSKHALGVNNPFYGKHHTEKSKQKISKANSGKNSYWYGKHLSEETKKKMSDSRAGENCCNSKLTEKQVFEILRLYYNKKELQKNIAKKYRMSDPAISFICNGKSWKRTHKKFMEENNEWR
jgi:hypothetical protein